MNRRNFIKGLSVLGLTGAFEAQAATRGLPSVEVFQNDRTVAFRRSVPRVAVDESDASVFVFPRLQFRTITSTKQKWDVTPSGDETMLSYMRKHTNLKISNRKWGSRVVNVSDAETIYKLPFIFMTGEGDFRFSPEDARVYGEFFKRGGFIYADDCVVEPDGDFFYKAYVREIQKTMPGLSMKPVPSDHEIYKCFFEMPGGRSPFTQGNINQPDMGLFLNNRMVSFLTAGDVHCGWWAGPNGKPRFSRKHEDCMKMGTNIVIYALTH